MRLSLIPLFVLIYQKSVIYCSLYLHSLHYFIALPCQQSAPIQDHPFRSQTNLSRFQCTNPLVAPLNRLVHGFAKRKQSIYYIIEESLHFIQVVQRKITLCSTRSRSLNEHVVGLIELVIWLG